MAERRFSGMAAAPGLAAGPIVSAGVATIARKRRTSAPDEAEAYGAALHDAIAGLRKLQESAAGDAAEIIGFQVAMLEDAALSEPVYEMISHGAPADQAWSETIGREIAGYESSDDEYFRARASDLADMRDRVLAELGAVADLTGGVPQGAVLLAHDLSPSKFLAIDWKGGGIALAAGSPSSHVAMLARARGIPMIVGLGQLPELDDDAVPEAILDGGAGSLVIDPLPETRLQFDVAGRQAALRRAAAEPFRLKPAVTADGTPIRVMINVGDPAELAAIDPAMCDGIGLVRTEFLFHAGGDLPDEEAQYQAYARIVRWAAGRPVVLRTLDAGGDKPIPGVTVDGESNPFLGTRGFRLSLARTELLHVQLRAMIRAAELGPVSIMVPMITVPEELEAARDIVAVAAVSLRDRGLATGKPKLGMMVEVPAAALNAAQFRADFYSIGSNDLTQYTMAAARDISAVAHLNDPSNPAVLALIERTVAAGEQRRVDVSLCGDAAGDPEMTHALLGTGLRMLSMAPASVAAVKQAIAGVRLERR